jgi:hypothetical protein
MEAASSAAALTTAASARDVLVLNPSFELPGARGIYYGYSGVALGDWDYTDYFLFTPTTSWKKGCFNTVFNNNCHIFLANPNDTWVDPLPGGNFIPDGDQVAGVIQPFATTEAAIQQDLAEVIAPNTTYTLTVWVAPGHPYGTTYPVTSSVQLRAILVDDAAPCCLANSVKPLLAEDRRTGNGTSGLVSGQWVESTVVYRSGGPCDPMVGRRLNVRLMGTTWMLFDDVRLTAETGDPNSGPTANAGPDQTVDEGTVVTLNGSASIGQPMTYQWTQTGGPPVTLNGATTATASFTAPSVGEAGCATLTFQLDVTSCGMMSTDTVVVKAADVFVLRDDRSGYCLRLNACTGMYTFKAGASTFTGPAVITRTPTRVNFQSAATDPNFLSGTADLGTRRGNVRYQVPRGGSALYNILDLNIDNNGPCP